jgi:acyl phosphate:glycerol-3-phosphate acyltransferase
MMIFATFLLAYLLGSIPFGLCLTQMAGLGDIRKVGSGNIGATNVMRTGHKFLGIATLLLDGGKGAAAIWAASIIYPHDFLPIVGLFAVLGHVFPVWLKFRGGKGVATAIGVLLALSWQIGLAVCAIWLLVFAITRASSLSSLLSIGWSSVVAYMFGDFLTTLVCLCLATLIVFTHRGNIKRLLQGNEHTFNVKGS